MSPSNHFRVTDALQPLAILDVVGLTPRLLGPHTPRLSAFAAKGCSCTLMPPVPAVTCSVQASLLTGLPPSGHGIVGNGWFLDDLCEIAFWRQSNALVAGEHVWDAARRRDERFTCANLFWWFNMGASHDIGVTPRPIYKADGRKIPDCYTKPASLRDELTALFGPFPLFKFWGPATGIESSRWIADATRHVVDTRDPTLTLAYLPHLDYDLQRHGPDPDHPDVRRSLQEIDEVAGDLIDHLRARDRRVLVLSEYGITAVDRPIHVNRHLREAGWLAVRREGDAELLDPFASRAFAVADHQVAHVVVKDPALVEPLRAQLAALPGVEAAWIGAERAAAGLDHARAGTIVLMSDARSWFTYYPWLDDRHAPDFARTVDIHRKPGYDPAELFVDPAIAFPAVAVLSRLARRKLGLRTLMDVIGLDASIVKGSHGRPTDDPADGPLLIADRPGTLPATPLFATEVKALALALLFPDT